MQMQLHRRIIMVLTKAKYNLRKTGIPLAEFSRMRGEQPAAKKPPMFIPADQAANVQLLTEILAELKEIKQNLKSKP